eukprot:1189702-Prorocentrum_minimum.AAC.6
MQSWIPISGGGRAVVQAHRDRHPEQQQETSRRALEPHSAELSVHATARRPRVVCEEVACSANGVVPPTCVGRPTLGTPTHIRNSTSHT